MTELGTRAVLRNIEAGLEARCPDTGGGCGQEVKFLARIPSRFRRRVVCNVYWLGKWNRVEQWHLACYVRAGMPHGRPPELNDDDLATIQTVMNSHENPWDVDPVDLLDELVDLYRKRRSNMHVATV